MSRWTVAGRGPEKGRVCYSREVGDLFVVIDGGDRGHRWEINISVRGASQKRATYHGSRGAAQRRASELARAVLRARWRTRHGNALAEAIADSMAALALVRTKADRVRVAHQLTDRLRRLFPRQLGGAPSLRAVA